MITPVTHLLPLTHLRRDRMLPIRGRVLFNVGDEVKATDIVAEADQHGDHLILDVRRALSLRNPEEANKRMRYKVGEKVEKGDILAQTGGIIPRVLRAQANGKVIGIHRGQIILEAAGSKLQIRAGISGRVTEVLPDRGLVIEGDGALLQGVWGNGKIASGMLLIKDRSADDELTRASLNADMRGAVVLAGHVTTKEPLIAAQELPINGLILASMTADLMQTAVKVNYPIILMEGFGRMPLNQAAFNLLSTNEKRDITLNGVWDADHHEKPELFIPLPAQGTPAQDYSELTRGKTVRVTVPPYAGQSALLVTIRHGLTLLANSQRVNAADIQLSTTQIVTVPLANLDVLE
ncbi:MAG TPA: hypothetical protein DCP32_02200 [Anaerolineaceae bacterium]|nr:MAG: hypothetical protein A2X24_00250 [Chloroflexi bacterium GWB2_54_36]HAL15590.1 hypothetical protein [Anaerolineaceae bacterium]